MNNCARWLTPVLLVSLCLVGMTNYRQVAQARAQTSSLHPNVKWSLGARPSFTDKRASTLTRVVRTDAITQNPPSSVDLQAYDPPVGDQGQVGSCVSWATGYYLRGWLANRYQTSQSFAPMYLYAQIVRGSNTGTSFNQNFSILQSQGIDTWSDYTQGAYDYTDQPTAQEISNAAPYKLSSVTQIWQNDASYGIPGTANGGTTLQTAIENTLANGSPVTLLMPVYDNFYYAGWTYPTLVGTPPSGMTFYGWHAVFASKYDSNGLWIENQWGTSWGQNGYAELSWAFVDRYVVEAWTAGIPATSAPTATPVPPTSSPTATPIPPTNTPTITPVRTATPVPPTSSPTTTPAPPTITPVKTATPIPTNTSTNIPAPTATRTPMPLATSTPTTGGPSISGVSASVGSMTGAFTVMWATNLAASSTILYGTTPALGSSISNATPLTFHDLTVTGLSHQTLYYFAVQSATTGGTSTSSIYTIRTK